MAAVLASGCGQDPTGSELPVVGGPSPDASVGEPGDAQPRDQTFAVHTVLRTTLSLGGRGEGVLCPESQEIAVELTSLVRRTVDEGRVHEDARLCSLAMPRFTVSAHGAIGGCDETREAQLAPAFEVGAANAVSSLEAPVADAGDALPMAFVLGAALDDPFAGDLPTYEEPERMRDDDGDGDPGITFVATGLPVLDDGAELYGALRVIVTPTSEGRAEAGFALSLVGSNAGLSGRTLQIVSPSFESGLEVELDRAVVGDDATCADLDEAPPMY